MSQLTKTLELDRLGIERLSAPEDVKVWLRRLVDTLEEKYKLVREFTVSGGFATKNWRGKEVGDNLEFQKKVAGTYTKKGAATGA